jgi:hypothetical protein
MDDALMSDRLQQDDTQQSMVAEQLVRFSAIVPKTVASVGVFDSAFGCASFLHKTKEQNTAVWHLFLARHSADLERFSLGKPKTL